MNQTEWDAMYSKLYDVYDYAGLRNEYVRKNIGELLDYMVQYKERFDDVPVWEVAQGGLINPPIRSTLHSFLRKPQMSVTFQANYKEVFATETVEKIEQLVEDNYDLDDILEFVDQNSEADLVVYYEDYVRVGENIGYDVVDAFVKYHGDMGYVENVEDAFRGVYYDEETFAEEYYNEIYGEVPAFLVVDWEATWKQSLTYDFDFVDGYVFCSNF